MDSRDGSGRAIQSFVQEDPRPIVTLENPIGIKIYYTSAYYSKQKGFFFPGNDSCSLFHLCPYNLDHSVLHPFHSSQLVVFPLGSQKIYKHLSFAIPIHNAENFLLFFHV